MENAATGMSFPSTAIDARLKDLGILVGLLTETAGQLTLSLEWFENPLPSIEGIPQNKAAILDLLRDLLGEKADISPDKNEWYQIKYEGKETPVYVVLPPDDTASTAVVSLGLFQELLSSKTDSANIWASIPLIELPLSDAIVVTGTSSDPITVALDLNSDQAFKTTNGTFTGLEFKGLITFEDDPTFSLDFLNMTPDSEQSSLNTLKGVLSALTTLSNWVEPILASPTFGPILSKEIPSTGVKIGDLLTSLGILSNNNTLAMDVAATGVAGYSLGDFKTLASKTSATACAEWILSVALKKLASREKPLVKIQEGGIYITSEETADKSATDYGLRVAVPDVQVMGEKKKSKTPEEGGGKLEAPDPATPAKDAKKKPNVMKLQVGKWLTGESDKDNWIKRADPKGPGTPPGISLFILRETGTTPRFAPRLELVSLGLDYNGAEKTPLASVKGVSIGGLEPRFYVSLNFGDLKPIPWGLSMRVDKFALPAGDATKGVTGNPVAANLLSSGKSTDAKKPKGKGADKQAVAPEFSAAISWVHDPINPGHVDFQLFDKKDKPSDKVILPIQRKFGPLFLRTFGLEWTHPNEKLDLGLIFDAKVTVAKLEVELKELSVGIPLRTPATISNYELGLEGLDFTFEAGSVAISGGLFKDEVVVDGDKIAEYNGQAKIKVGDKWNISAMGSWAQVHGHPSLFVFLLADVTLGGPPSFYVTGVSGGFGYNRALKVPAQDKVQDFPLVAGLTNPKAVGGKGATPAEALEAIKEYIPPAQGVNFFAAGVQFTSYELIKSNALVVVEFGKTFEVAVMGLSRIKLPQEGEKTFAYVELGLEVLFIPAHGVLSATLQVTPNSYVLTKDCTLTGGFAFFVWFDPSEHAGDFVLTVGGYSPAFKKPAWYPEEPRLGFNWKVSDQVSITGGAYFALTPSAIMAGGSLDVQFHSGPIHAWFTAHADFLVQWKPFSYLVTMGVSIGASITVKAIFVKKTIKVEVGATLKMWGPPMGGIARVHLWIASFSVSFGAGQDETAMYVAWDDFTPLLPQNNANSHPAERELAAMPEGAVVPAAPFENVVTLRITGGQVPVSDGEGTWLVRPSSFTFDVETAWPLTNLSLDGPNGATNIAPPTLASNDSSAPVGAREDGYFVGVRPMGINTSTSSLTLSMVYNDQTTTEDLDKDWDWTIASKSVPEALWGAPIAQGGTPKAEAKTLPGRMMGLSGVGPSKIPMTGPPAMLQASLAAAPINSFATDNDLLPLPQTAKGDSPTPASASLGTIANTINDAATVASRTALFNALGAAGVNASTNGDMSAFVDAVPNSFLGEPMLGKVAA